MHITQFNKNAVPFHGTRDNGLGWLHFVYGTFRRGYREIGNEFMIQNRRGISLATK
jgi:hypothetical protein